MADAGYASGFKLKMPYTPFVSFEKRFVWLADQYRRYLNIDPQVQKYDMTEIYKMRDSGDFHLYNYDTLAFLGDPDEQMAYFSTGNSANCSAYSNPKLDALWQQESQEMDPARRQQLSREIERILLTDLPAVPMAFNSMATGRWPHVKGSSVKSRHTPPALMNGHG